MKKLVFAIGGLIILLSSCTPLKVASDYDQGVNFNNYKTFQLLTHKSDFPKGANPINQKRLEQAIRTRMAELNFKESDNPDLWLTYFVKKETKESVKYYEDYYEEWNYKDQFAVFQYKVGTLIIDVIDVKKKQVVWHGALSREVNENMKTAEKRINRNINAMFDNFAKQSGRLN